MKNKKVTKENGFTLVEVVVSVALFALVMGAVFYFYANSMTNQAKLKEKYILLRVSREFIDSFINYSTKKQSKGLDEKEGYLFEWTMSPIEEKKDIIFASGIPPTAQLNMVHVNVIHKESKQTVLNLDFLANAISTKANE
ncbi:MAG: type II secretion system GspH family protein [Acidobacteria bacterium]|jgi:prepilin-type N-terminal cleavage/methylation domain-containing protein|nr:type II secretion system GspH family protein [Acidobacteriota bacterium]